ncbi:hypothetical protein NOF04DRAFT_12400 [Fusarium oxysporum II5]|uniref:Uncharacterized protein n=3 Tax=Fusarium oxysporum species complex TaxID=171631 RepID=N1REV0_FUSC4|nr:uncharacterized protein FOIG_02849 [Fusarium odoratissimum NRRL 54006]EMT65133.1 hypothetical protein FOC4_g10011110 [Fusarium odoratissimum]EXM07970.1 hypothetical protein FOIG_02849 [Fusarium odoratissimum NRRL 54006]KAK2131089.1 hypothetical protein NOF04DRAFT_12400 [Fusarium oxysporum II5]TXC10573.1 hypothetical protein FocTR4_00004940 [Fusarium oxysporum f. sp. cubense]
MSFNELLQEWCNARPATVRHTQVISSALRKSFFERVFQLWDSNETFVSLPELLPKKLRQTSYEAGLFKANLPVTPSKRKRGTTKQDNDHRMASAPAFLSVEFSSEAEGREFRLVWKDGGSTKVPVEYVKLIDGMTKAKAIEGAIMNWDRNERARVEEYNTKLIIALARMRIIRFAKAGTHAFPYIPQDLRVNNRTIQCKLITDEFDEFFQMMKAVHEGLSRSKLGAPNHMMQTRKKAY